MKISVNVRAANKNAAFQVAVEQIVEQCPADCDPQIWIGLATSALSALPSDDVREVVLDMDVQISESKDKFATAIVAELVAR